MCLIIYLRWLCFHLCLSVCLSVCLPFCLSLCRSVYLLDCSKICERRMISFLEGSGTEFDGSLDQWIQNIYNTLY